MLNTNILVLYTYICFPHIFVRLTYVVALIFSINIGVLNVLYTGKACTIIENCS